MQEGQDVYLEVFHTELEAFKYQVREHVVRCKSVASNNTTQQPSNGTNLRLDPKESQSCLTQVSFFGVFFWSGVSLICGF